MWLLLYSAAGFCGFVRGFKDLYNEFKTPRKLIPLQLMYSGFNGVLYSVTYILPISILHALIDSKIN